MWTTIKRIPQSGGLTQQTFLESGIPRQVPVWLGSSESSLFGFLTWQREMETETELRTGGSSLMSLPIWVIIPSGGSTLTN